MQCYSEQVAVPGGADSVTFHAENIAESTRLRSLSLAMAQKAWESEKQRATSSLPGSADSSFEDVQDFRPWWATHHDYKRLGLIDHPSWRVTDVNADFAICKTYPPELVVPRKLDDAVIEAAASFRGKGRLPALIWIHPDTGAPLCRCAQPRTGITGRCRCGDCDACTCWPLSRVVRGVRMFTALDLAVANLSPPLDFAFFPRRAAHSGFRPQQRRRRQTAEHDS